MSIARTQTRPNLPMANPNVISSQSKSHVLAGVQDAYWSDDETEDVECPLCLEEMDVSDLNFKPCICGYQVCRFCWHHIKENLNKRCPACRRVYTDEAVEFKPMNQEDHKRLTQQKKQKERERKELDALGRRHLANVRVVQRNVVYVIGIGPRFAKEELIPTLRSTDYFGQYGKINKIILVKRTPSSGGAPVVGLYITYHRREDAARCIAAVDGTASSGSGRDIMRASYGTTKYCMAFLRGASCSDHNCMNLHEWGDEKDCFTKEDLTTIKHTMKDSENKVRTTTVVHKKADEAEGLPRAASWAQKSVVSSTPTSTTISLTSTRPMRRGTNPRPTRTTTATTTADSKTSKIQPEKKAAATTSNKPPSQASSSRPPTPAVHPLPPRPQTPAEMKRPKSKERGPVAAVIALSRPSTPSVAAESDTTSVEAKPAAPPSPPSPVPQPQPQPQPRSQSPSPPPRPQSAQSVHSSTPSVPSAPAVPPGISSIPPGLSAPPGIPVPAHLQREEASHPPTPILSSTSSYQMSTAARALLEDVQARRDSAPSTIQSTPFPDFDRTLHSLAGGDSGGGFHFELDPSLTNDDADYAPAVPDMVGEPSIPFQSGFMDGFPAVKPQLPTISTYSMPPPGLGYQMNVNRSVYDPLISRGTSSPSIESSSPVSNYTGSFNPFGESGGDSSRHPSAFDDDPSRKQSRFGFARGRQGSTAASSPSRVASPLVNATEASYFSPAEISAPTPQSISWRQPPSLPNDYGYQRQQTPVAMNAPAYHPVAASSQQVYPQAGGRYQSFGAPMGVSEAQLRDLIQSNRRTEPPSIHRGMPELQSKYSSTPIFNDPAIMSAKLASMSMADNGLYSASHMMDEFSSPPLSYGPPPGISFPPGLMPSPALSNVNRDGRFMNGGMEPVHASTSVATGSSSPSPQAQAQEFVPIPSPVPTSAPPLSPTEFPALSAATATDTVASTPQRQSATAVASSPSTPADAQDEREKAALAKAEKKAAKKAAATERAAERQKIAQEKAVLRAAEKTRLAAEKAAEKEKVNALKAAAKEQLAQEKAGREKAEKEAAALKAKAEKEMAEQEKIALAKQKQEKTAAAAKKASTAAAKAKNQDSAKQPKTNSAASAGGPSSSGEPQVQVPLLSKMPKKHKPAAPKPIRIPTKDEESSLSEDQVALQSAPISEAVGTKTNTAHSSVNNSRSQSLERESDYAPTLADFFDELDVDSSHLDLYSHPFFDLSRVNPAAKMPLEYGPLVHALSALSVGGGSFANSMPSGSIDNAVSSFQQLLETLTQTISDLLRLLPRTTWDDSSTFDGVLRDMLKGDDFLDEAGEDGPGKEDEVAALTQALERRARWMEVQLSKLEELHRDINTAAVRAVLTFNDNGWDRHGFLPHMGNTLRRFDSIGTVEENGVVRPMTVDELEKKLAVAKEAADFAEAEVRESMQHMQEFRPIEYELSL